MQKVEKKFDVFISYSRKDYTDENEIPLDDSIVARILRVLDDNGITYWIDKEGIYSGDAFQEVICTAIEESRVFLFISSQHSNESVWTPGEVQTATDLGMPIVPFRADDTLYNRKIRIKLAPLDRIDYTRLRDRSFPLLVKSLKKQIEGVVSEQTSDTPDTALACIRELQSRIFMEVADKMAWRIWYVVNHAANRWEENGTGTKPEELQKFISDDISNFIKKELPHDMASCIIKCTKEEILRSPKLLGLGEEDEGKLHKALDSGSFTSSFMRDLQSQFESTLTSSATFTSSMLDSLMPVGIGVVGIFAGFPVIPAVLIIAIAKALFESDSAKRREIVKEFKSQREKLVDTAKDSILNAMNANKPLILATTRFLTDALKVLVA